MKFKKNKRKILGIELFDNNSNAKWWQFRKMNEKEIKYTGILSFLAGITLFKDSLIGDVLILASLACVFYLLFKHIKRKKYVKSKTDK